MYALLKCLLGIFVVLCFVEFIEMARLRRDETSLSDLASNLKHFGSNIKNALEDQAEHLKDKIDNFYGDNLENAFSSGYKSFIDKIKQIGDKID